MPKYRKKPLEIIAEKYDGTDSSVKKILSIDPKHTVRVFADHLIIHTLEGDHRADIGDFIIRGVAGELYPCKPDIFARTYEKN